MIIETLTVKINEIIKAIPKGKVMTYGQIAAAAGNPRGARQVVRVLHSMSEKHDLPWHRVVNKMGCISLTGQSYDLQKKLLEGEGVSFNEDGSINLYKHLFDKPY